MDSVTWKYKLTLMTRPGTVKQKKKKGPEEKRIAGVFFWTKERQKEKESKGKEISLPTES